MPEHDCRQSNGRFCARQRPGKNRLSAGATSRTIVLMIPSVKPLLSIDMWPPDGHGGTKRRPERAYWHSKYVTENARNKTNFERSVEYDVQSARLLRAACGPARSSSHEAGFPALSRARQLMRSCCKVVAGIKSKDGRNAISALENPAHRSSPTSPGTLNMISSVACDLHSDGGARSSQQGSTLRCDRALGHLAEAL